MKSIKKRTECRIQKKTSIENDIGEYVNDWTDAFIVRGVLSLQAGDSHYKTYNAKIEESTHVFICDYNADIQALSDTDVRCVINGKMYDITLIDNPDEMNYHLEIYLRYVGGQKV
jgi:SPP1 family predicted phage head-tail adaptor